MIKVLRRPAWGRYYVMNQFDDTQQVMNQYYDTRSFNNIDDLQKDLYSNFYTS